MEKAKVYTSFDGDDMLYIDMFRDFVIMKNKIPLNPTHALGYYISTTAHNNSKKLAMRDCCTIELLCDEFWIFTNTGSFDINNLPEGVVLELLIWIRNKKHSTIRFFNINSVIDALRKRDFSYDGELVDITESFIKNELETVYFNDLLMLLPDFSSLRSPVFIDLDFQKYKYVDWVKSYTFRNTKVPVVPHCVIPYTAYQVLGKEEEYINDLEVLSNSIEETWVIKKHADDVTDYKTITYSEVGIPKYYNSKSWALTSKELEEIEMEVDEG